MLLSRESQRVRQALTGERLQKFDAKHRFEMAIVLAVGALGLVVLVILPLFHVDIHRSWSLKIGYGFAMAVIVGVGMYARSYYPSNATLLLEEHEVSDKKT